MGELDTKSSRFKRICVFCGSSSGKKLTYQDAAVQLGKEMLKLITGIIIGLMGLVSQTVHDGGRHVLGVIPLYHRFHMALHLFFLISFLSSATLSLSYEPRNHEVDALISIRRSLNDPHGVLNNWDEDSVDPCSWDTITCSPENLVVGFGAPSRNLSGILSGRIGNLTNLRQVLLQNNNISGGIPPELGELPKLQTLDLSNNLFSSIVPPTLGQLHTLKYLRLNNNTLSGAFPVSLVKIPFLDLSFDNLSGPVPRFPARTLNIVGNPLICGSPSTDGCSGTATIVPVSFSRGSSQRKSKIQKLVFFLESNQKPAVAIGVGLSCGFLLLLVLGLLFWWRRALRNQTVFNINDTQEQGHCWF